jgi:uncharacterized protein
MLPRSLARLVGGVLSATAVLSVQVGAGSMSMTLSQGTPPAAPAPAVPPAVSADATLTPFGMWQGMVLAGSGAIFVRLDVRGDADHVLVDVTLPQAGALKQPAEDVEVQGPKLGLTLKAAGLSGRFESEVEAGGKTMAGKLTLSGGAGEPMSVPYTLARTGDAKATAGNQRWEGTLDVGGSKLPFAVTIADHPEFGPIGAIDIPMQSLEGFPLMVTKGDGGKITMRIPVGAEAVIDVAPKDELLVGEMRQGGMTIPVSLAKAGEKPIAGMARPQVPQPPFPYTEREVTIPHRFGHSLAGTFTVPKQPPASDPSHPTSPPKFPAVVLVSGSGPQDRDETIFGHKPFLVIADALARAGVAVLRYDDRGVGKSTGDFASASSHEFATDCDEATEWLRRQPDVDPKRIGIIGHSEGGLIAPMVAKWQWEEGDAATAVRFLVLLAGPGVSGRDVLAVQMRKLMAAEGATLEEIEAVSALQLAAMDAIVAEKPLEELKPFVRALVAKQMDVAQAHGKPLPTADIDAVSDAAVRELATAWMRTFMSHDPRTWIAALPIPVFAMQGGLDLQVDPQQNLPAIEAAAKEGNVPLTTKLYPKLNHLFQPATSGAVDEYGTIETTFDPEALKDLVDWVVKTSNDPALQSIQPKFRTPLPPPLPLPSGEAAPAAPVAPAQPAAPQAPPKPTGTP